MARVFVGNLPEDVRERDLSDKFERFGRISSVRIKFPTRPPPFAFIVGAPLTACCSVNTSLKLIGITFLYFYGNF